MKLQYAQPTEADAHLVLTWRNDPVTLSMSYHQTPKQWPAFLDEFSEKYFADDLPPVFGLIEGVRVGFLRFRRYPEPLPAQYTPACDISIMVAPEQRGKGYGRSLIALGTQFIHERGWHYVVAEVKPDNTTSARLFSALGYRLIDDYLRPIADLPQPIPVQRFVHEAL